MNPYHQGQLDFFCAVYAFINAMRLLFGIQLNQAREILTTSLSEISAQPLLWQAILNNRTDHHWVSAYMLGRFCGPGGFPARAAQLPDAPLKGLANAGDQEIRDWLNLCTPTAVHLQNLDEEYLYRPGVEFGPHMGRPAPGPKARARPWNTELLWPLLQRWLPSRKFIDMFGQAQKQKRCLILRFHRFVPYQKQPVVSHWSTGQDFSRDTLNLYDCTANKDATHALPQPEVGLCPGEVDVRRNLVLEPQSVIFLEKL